MSEVSYEQLAKAGQHAADLVESDACDWMPDPRAQMQMNLVNHTRALANAVLDLQRQLRDEKASQSGSSDATRGNN